MKNLVRLFVVSAALSVAAASQAAELNLNYTTSGTFSQTGSNVNKALTFTGGSFSTATVFNILTLNLGTFTIASGNTPPVDMYNGTFNLNVVFSAPTGISPTNAPTFSATLLGAINTDANGVVVISFTGGAQNFTFSNPTGSGSFGFAVNSTSFNLRQAPAPSTKILDGQGTGTFTAAPSVPAPGALASFGVGAMATLRRRRRASR